MKKTLAATTVLACHNSVMLMHPDGEVVEITSGDVCNRTTNVQNLLTNWLRDWCEGVDSKKHCRATVVGVDP